MKNGILIIILIFFPESFIRQIYPSDFQYRTIFYGLEAQLYENLTPFSQRIKDKILLTGAIGNYKTYVKVANLFKAQLSRQNEYFFKMVCVTILCFEN